MDLRVESASVGGFDIAGGGNGLVVNSFSWTKPPRVQRRPRPRAHGSHDLTRYYEGRLYNVAGLLYGLDEEDAQARLDSFEEALALDGDSVELRFRLAGRTDDETAQVRVDGGLEYAFDSQSRSVIRWAMTLFSEDPRRYGLTERTGSYDPTEAGSGTGIVFGLSFPIDFAGEATTHLDVENAGNFPTPPVFTITGPVTNPAIDNDTTGESIVLQGVELLEGEEITIDVAARSVRVGLGDSLLTNGDLSEALGGEWDAWLSTIATDASTFGNESPSLKVDCDASAEAIAGGAYQGNIAEPDLISVDPGTAYLSRANVKATTGQEMLVLVDFYDAASVFISALSTFFTGTGGFEEIVHTINPPANSAYVDWGVYAVGPTDGSEEFWIDDARLQALTGAARPDLVVASQTTWFELVKGENLLRLRGNDMVAGQTRLAVIFNDARI